MRLVHSFVWVLTLVVTALPVTSARASDSTKEHAVVNAPPRGITILSPPVLTIDFSDVIPLHNIGIAADGAHYYTCNGGNAGSGQLNTYDLAGNLLHSVPCFLDMRAIFYNASDGFLYAKTFEQDLYRVDPVTGGTALIHSAIFAYSQSSPALTPDGHTLLEHESGTIRFIDFATGALLDTRTGFAFGAYPSSEAVGTNGTWIFTWDGNLVSVYDLAGNLIESYVLPFGNYGFSLKFVHGLLFASIDGQGSTGHWYGYNVGAATPAIASSWGRMKALYR